MQAPAGTALGGNPGPYLACHLLAGHELAAVAKGGGTLQVSLPRGFCSTPGLALGVAKDATG